MNKLKKQKLAGSLNLIIGVISVFLILSGIFFLLGILEYLILLLVIIGFILFIWKSLIERKLK